MTAFGNKCAHGSNRAPVLNIQYGNNFLKRQIDSALCRWALSNDLSTFSDVVPSLETSIQAGLLTFKFMKDIIHLQLLDQTIIYLLLPSNENWMSPECLFLPFLVWEHQDNQD